MTHGEKQIKLDRMRYTKDTLSSSLVLLAIVLDVLYFVSIYQSDIGNYYYTWVIGASVVYNLVFLLATFLSSEGVKNRQQGYTPALLVLGLMQFARIFYLPMRANTAFIEVAGQRVDVMSQNQFLFVVICLAISGVCCIAGGIISSRNNAVLARYLKSLETQTEER